MLGFFDFAEKRDNRFLSFLYLAYPVITSAAYFYANSPILNLIANVVSLFIISLQYRTNLGKRITALGMTYFCMAILETIVTFSTNYIGVLLFKMGIYQNIMGLIIANLFIFMISHIIFYCKRMRKSVPIPIGFWVAIASVPTFSLFATLVILHNSRISQLKAIVVVIIFLIINGCVFILYDAFVASYC